MALVEKGDRVSYVPDAAHALNKDRDGNYAWAHYNKRDKDKEPLSHDEVDAHLVSHVITHKGRNSFLLVPLEPTEGVAWKAIVTGVNPDGTVNLDIPHPDPNLAGVTLNYNNIKEDPGRTIAHTWHNNEEE